MKTDKLLQDKFTLAASMVAAAIEVCPILADDSGQLFDAALNLIIYESRQMAKARRRKDKPEYRLPVGGGLLGGLFSGAPPFYPSKEELQRHKDAAADRAKYVSKDKSLLAELHCETNNDA